MLALTQREFHLIVEANKDKIHDRNEQEAMYAILYAAASRGKGKQGKLPQVKDLYDRNKLDDVGGKEDTFENILEKQKHTEKWLEQFDLSELTEKGGND